MTLPPYKPRRPYIDSQPDGYMESDADYMENNRHLAVALLDAYGEGKIVMPCSKASRCRTAQRDRQLKDKLAREHQSE